MEKNIKIIMPIKTGVTTNYSLFRRLKGNRAVSPKHVAEIRKSARTIGFLVPVISVNEKFEIIDGQHRFELAKTEGAPVMYAVYPGIGIDECVSLNINQRNWELIQYVESYAETGDPNYMRLLEVYDKTKSGGRDGLNIKVAATIARRKAVSADQIKKERYELSEEEAQEAIPALLYAKKFIKPFKNAKMRNADFFIIPGILYSFKEINTGRLYKQVTENIEKMATTNNFVPRLLKFNELYNYNLKKEENRVDITELWATRVGLAGFDK